MSGEGERFAAYFSTFLELAKEPKFRRAALAYGFHLVETAQNRGLYGGLRRLHKLDTDLAKRAVDGQHITRDKFYELFNSVFASQVPPGTKEKLKIAAKVRDDLLHGKDVTEANVWKAIFALAEYAAGLAKHIQAKADFEPFGDMRGMTARRGEVSLDKRTSRWVLKGMQFDLS